MRVEEMNLVILSGPIGVGKTTVAEELSGILEAEGIGHTLIDLDGLSKTFPRPRGDAFGEQIALKNLADVWSNARQLGVKNLIIARVVETRSGAERIAAAVNAPIGCIVQLNASNSTLLARVRIREIGAARTWHERRALELSSAMQSNSIADVQVDTDGKTAPEVASEIRKMIDFV